MRLNYFQVKHFFVLSFFCGVFFFSAQGATPRQVADSVLRVRGEVILSFILPDSVPLRNISAIMSVDNVQGSKVRAYANKNEFERFLLLQIPYQVVLPERIALKSKKQSQTAYDHYPTYSEYISLMQNLAQTYSSLCRYEQWGTTVNGRALAGLRITNTKRDSSDKPVVLMAGSIHGDEPLGYVLLLRLADSLLSNAAKSEIDSILTNSQIWICPLLNPDGAYYGGNDDISSAIRYNANYVDLNRNFPSSDGIEHPDGNAWQPETKAMMAFMKKYRICLSVNLHGGAEVVNYPWDAWSNRHPDDAWFQTISRAYADTVHVYAPSGYFTDLNNGITNGYDWYEVQGGRQDYATAVAQSREVTIELSSTKMVAENKLGTMWNYHCRSFIHFIGASQTGISGRVLDAETALPVKVTLQVSDYDNSYSVINSDSASGVFFRLLPNGNYTVQLSASGYISRNITTEASVMPKALPIYYMYKDTSGKSNNDFYFKIGPSPVSSALKIIPSESLLSNVKVTIYEISGRKVTELVYASMTSGQLIDVSAYAKGVYVIKLEYNGKKSVKKFVKQ
jgi:hypothetical protein